MTNRGGLDCYAQHYDVDNNAVVNCVDFINELLEDFGKARRKHVIFNINYTQHMLTIYETNTNWIRINYIVNMNNVVNEIILNVGENYRFENKSVPILNERNLNIIQRKYTFSKRKTIKEDGFCLGLS